MSFLDDEKVFDLYMIDNIAVTCVTRYASLYCYARNSVIKFKGWNSLPDTRKIYP